MDIASQSKNRRVLIASSHGLFAQGLYSLLRERQPEGVEVVGVVSNIDEAMEALDRLDPDLIIVDYDDESLNRDEFLARFVGSEKKLRVVLLSLANDRDAIIYDRRAITAAQIDDWLREWNTTENVEQKTNNEKMATQETPDRRSNMNKWWSKSKHLVIVSVLVVISTIIVDYLLSHIRLLPTAASAQAAPIDSLFRGEFAVISFLFSLIVVFMVYSIVVFRRRKGDTSDAGHVTGNTRLEITWTILPLITVLFFSIWGSQSLREVTKPEPNPLAVNVISQQWSWRFEYPQGNGSNVTSDKLYLPLNKPVVLYLSSLDVIHSFWVPEFRVKQDALPGGKDFVRELRITPTKPGKYQLLCAELCGQGHTAMTAEVDVVSQSDYDAWIAAQSNLANDPVGRGQLVAKNFGCQSCHSIDGSTLIGPTWKGLFGSQVPLADGTTVTADDGYLRESIEEPNAQIHAGFPAGVMPGNYKGQLTDQQIGDIIAYIQSLK